jgi:hypothetical protein
MELYSGISETKFSLLKKHGMPAASSRVRAKLAAMGS